MKGILILDEIPEYCQNNCVCEYDDTRCKAADRSLDYPTMNERRPDWCEIRPLPERRNTAIIIDIKREAEANGVTEQHQAGFNRGWNACLDAILGETNEKD